jgi:TetR/AcrR family transcriptional repressor of lmrAB and yxaGH operons
VTGTKGAETSRRLVASMLELIQVHGYSGTGLATVGQHAGAPRGSLYFHFPEGKEALGEQAVDLATGRFRDLLAGAVEESGSSGAVVRRVVDALAGMLEESDFRLGCPVSVVTLEMGAQSERLRAACAGAFESWIALFAECLVARGHPVSSARAVATVVVSTIEGAVVVSRAQRSVEPLRCAAEVLAGLLDQEVSS